MAEATNAGSGTGNTSIVALLVIFLVVVALGVGVFAYRGRIFGSSAKPEKVEINVTTPAN